MVRSIFFIINKLNFHKQTSSFFLSIAATRKISGVSSIGNLICIDYVLGGASPVSNVSQLLKAFADRLDLLFVCRHRKI